MKVLVVGLGQIGLGLIVPVFRAAGYSVFGTDVSSERLGQLKRPYQVKTPSKSTQYNIETIPFKFLPQVDLVITSVGRRNVKAVVEVLEKNNLFCPIMLAENLPNAITIARHIPIVVDRICPRTEWLEEGGLTVYAEDDFRIVTLDTPLARPLRTIEGVQLFPTVELVERARKQKMFTVNTSHAVLTTLGSQKGYRLVEEAAGDAEIQQTIREIVSEVSEWLELVNASEVAEKIIKRFRSPLGDTIERILGPVEKRGRNEYIFIPLREVGERKAPTLKKIADISVPL